FFQAEDGIRDLYVTGVQTCALPILVTTIDGYQMARQGRAGAALATAAIGSFFAGTAATFLIALFAPPLADVALKFGPVDYFSLKIGRASCRERVWMWVGGV